MLILYRTLYYNVDCTSRRALPRPSFAHQLCRSGTRDITQARASRRGAGQNTKRRQGQMQTARWTNTKYQQQGA